jgi:hypothetical protein
MHRAGETVEANALWRAFIFNRWLLTREGDWKFVTKNSIDFCGPADAPGSKGEYRKAMIHAGLICLNGPVGMDLDMQIKLFETALDELDQNSDLINQGSKSRSTMRTMQNSRSYDTNCLRCPFHSQKEQPEDARIAGPGGEGCNTVLGKPSLGDDLVQNLRMALKNRGRVDLKKGVNNER